MRDGGLGIGRLRGGAGARVGRVGRGALPAVMARATGMLGTRHGLGVTGERSYTGVRAWVGGRGPAPPRGYLGKERGVGVMVTSGSARVVSGNVFRGGGGERVK